MNKRSDKRYVLLWGLLIFLVPFVIYANSLQNDFLAGDDEEIVLRNEYLRGWKYLPNIFTEQYKSGAGGTSDFWRPFQLLVYSLIVQTVGIKPLPFHIASILFHSLCGVLLYTLFLKLFKPQGQLFLSVIGAATLIWLVHPIANSEIAVTTGIASPTYLFWMLMGFFAFMLFEERKEWAWLVLSLVSFILSLCSKESGIVFPGLLLGMHATGIKTGIFKKTDLKAFIRKHILFWVVAFLYVIGRLTVLNFGGTLSFYKEANIFTENFSYRLYTIFTILAHGLGIIFVPAGLHSERSWPVFINLLSKEVLLAFLLLSAVIALAIMLWKKNPLFTFGIFWFFGSYLPMSNLFAQINALVWDHWFYVPSAGIFLSIIALAQDRRIRGVSLFVLIPVVIILSSITLSRNRFWRDTEARSRFILSFEPHTVKTWNNLGMALAAKGKHQEAINCYLKSIGLSDIYPQTHHNLANEYVGLGKYSLAETEYLKALNLNSNFYHAYLGLGKLYLMRGDVKTAVFYFQKALAIYPHLPEIKEFLSRVKR